VRGQCGGLSAEAFRQETRRAVGAEGPHAAGRGGLAGGKNRYPSADAASAKNSNLENSAQGPGGDVSGGSAGDLLRLDRGRCCHSGDGWTFGHGGAFELPHFGRT